MMIELMTYRIGHHTTSDDSLRCDDSCVCDVHPAMCRLARVLGVGGPLHVGAIRESFERESREIAARTGH